MRKEKPPSIVDTIVKNVAEGGDDHEALAEDVLKQLRRFVSVPNAEAVFLTTWIMYAHLWDKFSRTPYVAVQSAEKMSGKTTVLKVIRQLVPNARVTVSISGPALYRVIQKEKPILLIDEMDTVFGKNGSTERGEALRGVLNAGFERGGKVTLCEGHGGNIKIVEFEVYCPKVMACIGRLPDTIESRAVGIRMRRRTKGEEIEPLDEDEPDFQFGVLRDRLARFAKQVEDKVRSFRPEIPKSLSDRGRDISKPLLAVAEAIGPAWLEITREALAELLAPAREEQTTGVQLLKSIKVAFEEQRANVLKTSDLLKALHEMDGEPWADWYGKPITGRKVGEILKGYGIAAKHFQSVSGSVYGYCRTQFLDSWDRYIVPEEVDAAAERQAEEDWGPELPFSGPTQ